jgi:hypothetical protein
MTANSRLGALARLEVLPTECESVNRPGCKGAKAVLGRGARWRGGSVAWRHGGTVARRLGGKVARRKGAKAQRRKGAKLRREGAKGRGLGVSVRRALKRGAAC